MTSSLSLVLWAGAALAAQGDVMLLDFSAEWCGPCRQMAPIVARLEREGYPVRQVDVDQEPRLAKQFGIQGIPAFVLVQDGREVDRVVGTTTASHLKQLLDRAGAVPGTDRLESNRRGTARAQSPDASVIPVKSSTAGQLSIRPAISAPSQSASEGPSLMGSSVRVRVRENGASAYGSGTIVSSTPGEAVVLTCGHIFREAGRNGEVLVDVFDGSFHTTIPGQVISFDLEADVGLVRVETDAQLSSVPVAPRSYAILQGAQVATVGCSGGAAPSAEQGRITAVNRYLGPANIECSGLPVQGRSGGGLFSSDGYVIGVCSAADPSEGRGLYAGLDEIHKQLAEAGLSGIADDGRRGPAPNSRSRGAQGAVAGTRGNSTAPGNGSLSESDVVAEIAGQFEESEVVCVIRSLKDPRAKSRVIVLDRASAELLAQLDRERQVQDSRHLTSFQQPDRPRSQPLLRIDDLTPTDGAATRTPANEAGTPRLAGRRVSLAGVEAVAGR